MSRKPRHAGATRTRRIDLRQRVQGRVGGYTLHPTQETHRKHLLVGVYYSCDNNNFKLLVHRPMERVLLPRRPRPPSPRRLPQRPSPRHLSTRPSRRDPSRRRFLGAFWASKAGSFSLERRRSRLTSASRSVSHAAYRGSAERWGRRGERGYNGQYAAAPTR